MRKLLLIVLALIVLLWILNIIVLTLFFGRPEGPGVFGDMFGAINALFSGLAFWGVIYAIILQKEELVLQREELKLSRLEMKKTSEALDGQLQMMKEEMVINKRTEIARKKRLKPKFRWQLGSTSGSPEALLIRLRAEYDRNICPETFFDHIEGGNGFNGGVGNRQGIPSEELRVQVRLNKKALEKLKFRFRYSDAEGDYYEDIIQFFTKNNKIIVLESE